MNDLILLFRGAVWHPFNSKHALGDNAHLAQRAGSESDGRLYALDLARFIAMLFMMQGHVLDTLVSTTFIDINVFPWNAWHQLRGFTAPIFLMVSGAVHAFATKRSESGSVRADVISKRIRWALTIVGIGYLLVFPASRVWDLPFVDQQGWSAFLSVNILQLTGATMLMFIATMASTKSVRQMGIRSLGIAVLILALTPVLQFTPIAQTFPIWVRSYVTTANGSLFPIFPFSAYLFLGLAIGSWLHGVPPTSRDKALQRYSWRFGLCILLVAVSVESFFAFNGVSSDVLEHPMSVLLFARRVGVVMMFFSVCVVVLNYTWGMRKWYSMFGTKSLYIYVIHLLLLFGTPWMAGIGRTNFRSFDLATGIALAVGIIFLTLLASAMFDWYARQPWAIRVRTAFAYVGTATLCYLLLV